MAKKQIDSRVPGLIRKGAEARQRSLFVIVGDKARNQLPNLHYLMMSANMKMNKSILWAYKKELLGFTSHRKKREKKIKQEVKKGVRQANDKDPFEAFVTNQHIRYVYYKETEKILGQTFGMCILQDFEALTPNLLARTIETVEGGGIIIIMLKSMNSLKQMYTMNMDVHSRFRTEAYNDVVARFNERFLLSLGACSGCLVVDDELTVLPIVSSTSVESPVPIDHAESKASLTDLTESLEGVEPAHALVSLAKTLNQAQAVLSFIDSVSEKSLSDIVALTAGRGRGKSAALGISLAAAISHGYSNIFVTSPSPENLNTLFEFVVRGFEAMNYTENSDYNIVKSTNPAFHNAVVRIDVKRTHRQTIQYIVPTDWKVLGQAELVVVDEAAAIPLPHVQRMLGDHLVWMASTVDGYEGTGRSLQIKLVNKLRDGSASGGRALKEISLSEPIRYAEGDPVEKWLNKLLCLDARPSISRTLQGGTPHPSQCELFYVNRDTLFSFHPVSESFLHKVMGLYGASHYKNTPNDLQLISDSPSQMLFVLLSPTQTGRVPEPLCVVQLALEGQISQDSVRRSLGRGARAAGDLIPWVVSQQFQDEQFAGLSGGRVVRIATSPEYTGMGYGGRALELLAEYFKGNFTNIDESSADTAVEAVHTETPKTFEKSLLHTEKISIRPANSLPPLLLRLPQHQPPFLQYLGVSFGLTPQLHKFWARKGYRPVYLRQTANELTGEHTCVMLNVLSGSDSWLDEFSSDFRARFLELLSFGFRGLSAQHALRVLSDCGSRKHDNASAMSPFDLKRLSAYARNMLDYHVVLDLVPKMAISYFNTALVEVKLSSVQQVILLGIGLQRKSVDDVSEELGLPVSQTLAMFAKIIKKMAAYYQDAARKKIADEIGMDDDDEGNEEEEYTVVGDIEKEIDEELEREGKKVLGSIPTLKDDEDTVQMSETQKEYLQSIDMSKYEIDDEEEWDEKAKQKGMKNGKISVKSGKRKLEKATDILKEEMGEVKKMKKKSKKKKSK